MILWNTESSTIQLRMNFALQIFLTLVFVTLFVSSPTATAQTQFAVPGKSEQKAASKKLKEIFGKQLASKNPEQLETLLDTLLEQSRVKKPDDIALHYVVLRECVEVATKLAKVEVAWDTNLSLNDSFELDRVKNNRNLVRTMLKSKSLTREGASKLLSLGIKEAENLMASHHYSEAEKTALYLKMVAKKLGSRSPMTKVETVAANSRRLNSLYPKVVEQIRKVEAGEGNESDFQAVGEFYCLDKGDFEAGLAYLAKGVEGPLKNAATAELQGPKKEKVIKRIADIWWDESQRHKAHRQDFLLAQATKHYEAVLDDLVGLERKSVENRLQQFYARSGLDQMKSSFDRSKIWRVTWEDNSAWKQLQFLNETECRAVATSTYVGKYRFEGRYMMIVLPRPERQFLFTFDGDKLIGVKKPSGVRGEGVIVDATK